MKKIICLLVVACMVLGLAGCGADESPETTANELESGIETDGIDETAGAKETEAQKSESVKSDLLKNTYKVPGKAIVIDVPNYQEIEKGYTQLYILNGERYVAITADDASSVNSVSEAHEVAFEIFKENIQNYSYVNSLSIESDSTETIGDIEVYKFEGTLNCALDYSNRDNAYDAYAIGYSFIMDGVPCTVIGSVIDEAQEQDMIDEMKATVEAMILTLRSER